MTEPTRYEATPRQIGMLLNLGHTVHLHYPDGQVLPATDPDAWLNYDGTDTSRVITLPGLTPSAANLAMSITDALANDEPEEPLYESLFYRYAIHWVDGTTTHIDYEYRGAEELTLVQMAVRLSDALENGEGVVIEDEANTVHILLPHQIRRIEMVEVEPPNAVKEPPAVDPMHQDAIPLIVPKGVGVTRTAPGKLKLTEPPTKLWFNSDRDVYLTAVGTLDDGRRVAWLWAPARDLLPPWEPVDPAEVAKLEQG